MKISPTSRVAFLALTLLATATAYAHCPLCTAGAGALALGAAQLGVGPMSIGIFLGAFAIALGLWVARFLKKRYLPGQTALLAVFSFATTIFPLQAILSGNTSLYLPFWGDYGKTFVINLFLVGSIVGGLLILAAPHLSKKLALARGGEVYPFQGMIVTLVLLVAAAAIAGIAV